MRGGVLPKGAPAIPMAIRLPRQPLLGFLVQTIASCLWRPYPSLSDVVLYMVRCVIFLHRDLAYRVHVCGAAETLSCTRPMPGKWCDHACQLFRDEHLAYLIMQ